MLKLHLQISAERQRTYKWSMEWILQNDKVPQENDEFVLFLAKQKPTECMRGT